VGLSVDRRLVETAALLHDIDKALPSDHPVRELGHGHAGAAWLSEAGHPELARAIAAHPVMRLNDPGAEEWIVDAPLEERLVTYADKRGTQRVVSLEKRFARWRCKHPSYRDQLDSAFVMASRLEQSVCAALGLEPGEVERLRWVDDALVRATAAGFIDMDAIMATPALTSADASGDRPAPA
jgi:putative nucleotidyltransferase with HDIG domain